MGEGIKARYGWVCPKCERVYSPDQTMCLYCGRVEVHTTTFEAKPGNGWDGNIGSLRFMVKEANEDD